MQAFKGYLIGITFIFGLLGSLDGYYLLFRLGHEPFPVPVAKGILIAIGAFYGLVFLGYLAWRLWEQCQYAICFIGIFRSQVEDTPHNAPE